MSPKDNTSASLNYQRQSPIYQSNENVPSTMINTNAEFNLKIHNTISGEIGI